MSISLIPSSLLEPSEIWTLSLNEPHSWLTLHKWMEHWTARDLCLDLTRLRLDLKPQLQHVLRAAVPHVSSCTWHRYHDIHCLTMACTLLMPFAVHSCILSVAGSSWSVKDAWAVSVPTTVAHFVVWLAAGHTYKSSIHISTSCLLHLESSQAGVAVHQIFSLSIVLKCPFAEPWRL